MFRFECNVGSYLAGGGRPKSALFIFQLLPTLGCQDSSRRSVVKSEFIRAENFLPTIVGSLVEECFRAPL